MRTRKFLKIVPNSLYVHLKTLFWIRVHGTTTAKMCLIVVIHEFNVDIWNTHKPKWIPALKSLKTKTAYNIVA